MTEKVFASYGSITIPQNFKGTVYISFNNLEKSKADNTQNKFIVPDMLTWWGIDVITAENEEKVFTLGDFKLINLSPEISKIYNLNFGFIALEKLISFDKLKVKSIYKRIYMLFAINLGWVIFRSENLIYAGRYIASMFGFRNNGFWSAYTFMFIKENIFFFAAAVVLLMPISRIINKRIVDGTKYYTFFQILYPFTIIALFLISISFIIKNPYVPFIY